MRKNFVFLLLACVLALVLVSCAGSEGELPSDTADQFEILIRDTISIDVYQPNNRLEPQLMNRLGDIVESRFKYEPSSDDIEISFEGIITIKNIPQEDVTVLITERNTGVQKTVTLCFVDGINEVSAISDTNGREIKRLDNLVIGESYTMNIVTNQGDIEIEQYCEVHAESSGQRVDSVFEVSFDKSHMTVKALGIGSGDLSVSVYDNSGNVVYSTDIPFSITMNDHDLSEAILNAENKKLLSADMLSDIDHVVVSKNVKDLAELSFLPNLKSVVIEENEPIVFKNINENYFYRVPELAFESYYLNQSWSAVQGRLIPYSGVYNEKYIIYHSSKGDDLFFAAVGQDFSLADLSIPGYQHQGWTDASNVTYTDVRVQEMSEEYVHLYAILKANDNKMIFDGNGATGGQMEAQLIRTDTTAVLTANGFVRSGYSFVGWSETRNGSVKYQDSGSYFMGTDPSYTLYAVWKANDNKIVFDANGGKGDAMSQIVKTDATATLLENTYSRDGYEFNGWSLLSNGDVDYADGESYTMGPESVNTLYALWKPITYKITYDLNGGVAGNHPSEYTIESDDVKLGTPTKAPYSFAGWIGTDLEEAAEDAVIKTGSFGDRTYTAMWASKITFNANGGNGEMKPQNVIIGESAKLNKNTFYYAGHMFMGWSTTPDGEVEYTKDAKFFNSGDEHAYTLYAIWTEGTEGLEFKTYQDHCEVIAYVGDEVKVVIPEKYLGLPVTNINEEAVSGNTKIAELHIPVSVTSISMGAFSGCNSLKILKMPVVITTMNDNGVMKIMPFGYYFGTDNYYGSTDIFQYVSRKNATKLSTSDGVFCYYLPIVLKKIELIGGADIPTGYFFGCDMLEEIVLPETLITIGASVFDGCTKLTTIDFPMKLEKIGERAFAECTHLTEAYLPETLKTIGFEAFKNCLSMNAIFLPFVGESSTGTTNTHFGYIFGAQSSSANRLNVPASLKYVSVFGKSTIANNAFYECNSIAEIWISGLTSKIGESAFKDCSALQKLIVIADVQSIGKGALVGCSNLREITIPFVGNTKTGTSNTYFGYIFGTDSSNSTMNTQFAKLTSVTVSGGTIYAGAFANCGKIQKIELGNGVTTIKSKAFSACTNLVSIKLGSGLKTIEDKAFVDCYRLIEICNDSSLSINSASEQNGSIALYASNIYKSSVGSTRLMVDGEYIYYISYAGVYVLVAYTGDATSVTLPSNIQGYEINSYAFCGNTKITSVVIPNQVIGIGQYAFANCTKLTTVTIGSGVKEIGAYAFKGDSALSSAAFQNTNNWYVAGSQDKPVSIDVSKTSTAATNLKDKYCAKAWVRDDNFTKKS